MGGVYSISPSISLSPLPTGELVGQIYFQCDPGRVAELTAAVESRLTAIAQGSVDADAFAKSIEALIKSYEDSIQSNLYIAQSYANSAVIYQSALTRLQERPGYFRGVTPAAMQGIMSRLLAGGQAVITLYPEN